MDGKEITDAVWKIVDSLLYDAFMAGVKGDESMDLVLMKVRFTSAFEHSMERLFEGQEGLRRVSVETTPAARLKR